MLQSVRETRVRPLDLDGVPCTDATLRGGSYPLVTSAFLLAREQPGGLAAAFLAFVESPAGKEIMRSHGLTPAP